MTFMQGRQRGAGAESSTHTYQSTCHLTRRSWMQRREPQVRKVELKNSQFFKRLTKPSPPPLLSSAKNSKTCVTVYMRMTCYKGKAQLLSFEQTPVTQSLGILLLHTSPSTLILRRGVNFKRFITYIMMLSIQVMVEWCRGRGRKRQTCLCKPTLFVPACHFCHPLEAWAHGLCHLVR